jgi:hypothetical protein
VLVADVAVAVILGWSSWYVLRAALRTWRGAGTPLSRQSATALMDPEARAGFSRGALAFGLGWAFMAIFLAGFALAKGLHTSAHNRIVGGLLSAAAVAMIVCIGLGVSVVEFNRPKFLVPPPLRGEPGAFAAGRRRRRQGGPA